MEKYITYSLTINDLKNHIQRYFVKQDEKVLEVKIFDEEDELNVTEIKVEAVQVDTE